MGYTIGAAVAATSVPNCPPSRPPPFLGAGSGDVGVVLEDPAGRRDTVEVTLEDRGDSTFRCSYRPTLPGPHRVAVTFAGAHIPNSPFCVNVAEGEPP